MKYYVMLSSFDWADEIDLEGFVLFTEDELAKEKELFERIADESDDESQSFSLGSNEDMWICPSEVVEELENVVEISKSEYDFLNNTLCNGTKKFGKSLWGLFDTFDFENDDSDSDE